MKSLTRSLALLAAIVFVGACTQAPTAQAPGTNNERSLLPVASATPKPTPSPTLTPTATPPPPPHLILWHSLDPAQAEQLKEEAKTFVSDYPNVSIDIQHYASEQELSRALEAGSIDFDIVLGSTTVVEYMQVKGLILPADQVFTESFIDTFLEVGVEGGSRHNQVWGVPQALGLELVLFYNQELLPEPPENTAAMIERAEKLTDLDQERYGLVMNYSDPLWLIPWLSGFGGWLVDEQGQPTLDTTAMTRALRFLHDLKFESRIVPAQIDYDVARDLFMEGRAAMLIDGEWALPGYRATEGLRLGLAPLPRMTDSGLKPTPLIAGRYFVVGAYLSGGKLEAARLFIEYMTRSETQLQWTRAFGVLPTSKKALKDDLIQDDPFLKSLAAQMATGRAIGLGPALPVVMEAMRSPLEKVMNDELTPAAAARQMQTLAEQELD